MVLYFCFMLRFLKVYKNVKTKTLNKKFFKVYTFVQSFVSLYQVLLSLGGFNDSSTLTLGVGQSQSTPRSLC